MTPAPLYTDIARAPAGGKAHWLTCSDGTKVRVAYWPGGRKGTVLLFQGRTEYIEKYGPVVEKFQTLGYTVVAIDWRGQGLSDRSGKQHKIGHVASFDEFQLDVAALMEFVGEINCPKPYVSVAHSMGGAIGLRALLNGQPIAKAIFSAPMWGIYFKGIMKPVSRMLVGAAHVAGRGASIAPSTHAQNYVMYSPFEDNTLTNDKDQFEWSKHQLTEHSDLELGGPSMHWIREAMIETARLRRSEMPSTPCLCAYGTQERIVSINGIEKVMDKWPNGKLLLIQDAQHELFIEEQHVRHQFWSEIETFLAN